MTDEAVDMPTAEAVIDSVKDALPALGVQDRALLKSCYANDVWFLATSAGTVVAKVRRLPEEDPLQIAGQERALTSLAANDFPTPELLHLEPAAEALGGRQFSIFRFMEGQPADECLDRLRRTEQRGLFRDFGEMVGRLHALDLPTFAGWVDDSGNPHTTWAGVLQHMLREAVDELGQADPGFGIPADLGDRATAVLAPAIDTIPEPTPRFVHRDLHLGNLMVHNARAIGLLDFEMVREWDPRWDFPKLSELVFRQYPDSFHPFALGYREHVPDHQEDVESRDWLYTGFRHLLCAADYLDGNAAYARAPRHLESWLADTAPRSPA